MGLPHPVFIHTSQGWKRILFITILIHSFWSLLRALALIIVSLEDYFLQYALENIVHYLVLILFPWCCHSSCTSECPMWLALGMSSSCCFDRNHDNCDLFDRENSFWNRVTNRKCTHSNCGNMGNVISSVYDLWHPFQFSFWLASNIKPILQLLPEKSLSMKLTPQLLCLPSKEQAPKSTTLIASRAQYSQVTQHHIQQESSFQIGMQAFHAVYLPLAHQRGISTLENITREFSMNFRLEGIRLLVIPNTFRLLLSSSCPSLFLSWGSSMHESKGLLEIVQIIHN